MGTHLFACIEWLFGVAGHAELLAHPARTSAEALDGAGNKARWRTE